MQYRVKPGPAVVSYDSDDERAYDKEEQPDATSSEYFHDEVDEFHAGREKVMTSLWRGKLSRSVVRAPD